MQHRGKNAFGVPESEPCQYNGDVILPACTVCRINQFLSCFRKILAGTDNPEDLFIFYHVRQTVRTQQSNVTPVQGHIEKVNLNITSLTDRPGDDVFLRMIPRLIRPELSGPDHLFHERMIVRNLLLP